jgi:hypothetical protein
MACGDQPQDVAFTVCELLAVIDHGALTRRLNSLSPS